MSANTRNPVSMILAAVLIAGAAFDAPAFAGETSLAQNERAAQEAIVAATPSRPVASFESASPTLAHNEISARRVIVDIATPEQRRNDTIGDATLMHNEIAAMRSIVEVAGTDRPVGYAGSAPAAVASMRTPTAR